MRAEPFVRLAGADFAGARGALDGAPAGALRAAPLAFGSGGGGARVLEARGAAEADDDDDDEDAAAAEPAGRYIASPAA